MTITVIQIGLHPGVVDYGSPEFASFPGLTPDAVNSPGDIRRWFQDPALAR